jgi:hypothetical protein
VTDTVNLDFSQCGNGTLWEGPHAAVTEPMPASVPPQPPVIADAEVCQGSNGEPVSVAFARYGQLNVRRATSSDAWSPARAGKAQACRTQRQTPRPWLVRVQSQRRRRGKRTSPFLTGKRIDR